MYKTALKTPGSVLTLSKIIESSIDPVALLQSLSRQGNGNNRMLLESCEIESKQQLKSILLNKAALKIECQQQRVIITSLTHNGLNALNHLAQLFEVGIHESEVTTSETTGPKETNKNEQHQQILVDYCFKENDVLELDEESRLKRVTPIDCLRKIHGAFQSQNQHSFGIFLAGLFSFDFIASFEDLPEVPFGDNDCADFVFYLAEEVILFEHQTRQINIYSNVFAGEGSEKHYFEQSRRIESISSLINEMPVSTSSISSATENFNTSVYSDLSDDAFKTTVTALKKEIVAGNVFQVVPSRTFSIECRDNYLSYQKLKITNPSPYMFYMQDENFTLFGASPESALKYQKSDNKVELYPIAGTRARGKFEDGQIDHDKDKRLEVELKLDNKEISEHMMLVDLARNDIARISNNSSLQIPRLLEVDRYSQVMHLVSCVQGELRSDLDCFHAYQACMNMGTLTGAPKIKATELIRETEKKRRGSYGGAVGYINTAGDMDTCIVIRSAFCKNGTAHIQAGAGIVYDSKPQAEADETRSKANAVIQAIQQANQILQNKVNQPV